MDCLFLIGRATPAVSAGMFVSMWKMGEQTEGDLFLDGFKGMDVMVIGI